MKITLKKAQSLVNQLRGLLKNYDVTYTSTELTDFDEVNTFAEEFEQLCAEKFNTSFDIISTIYSIREKVATANSSISTNELLTQIAKQSELLKLYEGITSGNYNTPASLKGVCDTNVNSSMYNKQNTIHPISQTQMHSMEEKSIEVRRELNKLKDVLENRNYTNHIDLNTDEQSVLESLGLL